MNDNKISPLPQIRIRYDSNGARYFEHTPACHCPTCKKSQAGKCAAEGCNNVVRSVGALFCNLHKPTIRRVDKGKPAA